MNKIIIAYVIQILLFFGSFFSYFFLSDVSAIAQIAYYVAIIPTALLIMSDAKERGIPKYHGWWAVLGIIGVLIYHFGFARKVSSTK